MSPLNSNEPYIKDTGERSTLGAELEGSSAIPAHSQSDAGKVLTVGEDGSLEWDEKGGAGGVLTGTSDPAAGTGENNDIYLKYFFGTDLINSIKNLAMTSDTYTDSEGFTFKTTSSGNVSSSYHAYEAFDGEIGDDEDAWHPSAGTDKWLAIEFPRAVVIKAFTIYNRTNYPEKPETFKVQGSNDGTNYTDLKEVTWSETGKGLHLDVTLTNTTPYKYFRIYETSVQSSYGVIALITFTDVEDSIPSYNACSNAYIKSSGSWVNLIGADISDLIQT